MTDRYKQVIIRVSDEVYQKIREDMWGSRLNMEEYVRNMMLYEQLAMDEAIALQRGEPPGASDGRPHWRYYNGAKDGGVEIVLEYFD